MKKRMIFSALIVLALSAGLLSGCGGMGRTKLYVYNWGEYIDKEVLRIFERENPDIKVVYETFETNEIMYSKVKAGGSNYDVVIPSDYMIQKMIDDNLLAKIDVSTMENYKKIGNQYKSLYYDPNNEYSVPYFWGTVGIIYNTELVNDEIDSWNALWDEKYKNNIFMLDSARDSIAVSLLRLGYSINTTDENELTKARDQLIAQKPLVLQYGVDTLTDKMIAGEGAMSVCWSGDAMYMTMENEKLRYVVPKEGSNIWYDAMCVLKTSVHQEEAARFIDFMCRTDIAKMNTEEVCYSTPQLETLEQLDANFRENEIYNPPADIVERCAAFKNLSAIQAKLNEIWTEVGVAK